jgi:hypothetical protein
MYYLKTSLILQNLFSMMTPYGLTLNNATFTSMAAATPRSYLICFLALTFRSSHTPT